MELIDFKSSCKDCCDKTTKVEGCASGVSYILYVDDTAIPATLRYRNLQTGAETSTAPTNFVLGNCIDAMVNATEVLVGDTKPTAGTAAPTGSKLYYDTTTNKITSANVDGFWVDISDSSFSFSNILAPGNKILTITDSEGVETDVYETITDVTAITNGFSYTNEAGVSDDITFEINDTDPLNTKVEVKLNGTKVAEFPLYTVNNDIQINNAGSEWSFTDDQITILETNGDSQVLNFPYRVTVVANPNGTIDIKQNGVTIGTIPAQTVTTLTNTVTGHKIGTYTNEASVAVDINETITSIGTITYDNATGVLTIPYTDEAGVVNNKTVTLPAFKELNQFHVDKNGNDTTGVGADENPVLTITKALTLAGQADVVIVNEGTYAEAVTISTQNLTLRGQGQEYGGLTEINSLAVTAAGTSVRASSLTVLGNATHSGTSPLYLSDTTVIGNYTSSTTAYSEIKNSRLQTGTISKTAAGILFVQDSLIGNATFSTANSVISLRNVTIDAGKKVTIGAGVIYSMQDVVGDVEINAAAIAVETALLAQGATAEQAKDAQTSSFNMLRMLDPDINIAPTDIVTLNPTTKRLEISPIANVSGDKYATTSTTCQNISTASGDITIQVAPGLAYLPLQTIAMIDAANSANHMHCDIVSYDKVTGVMVVNVKQKSGTNGTICNWVVGPDSFNVTATVVTVEQDNTTGKQIGSVTVNGTTTDLYETVTSMSLVGTTLSYTNENGIVTTATIPQGSNVTFDTVAPTGTGNIGDEHFITNDGTNTGTITSSYIFDGSTWVLRPTSAPEKVEFGTLIPTSATGYTAGDEYFVTDNGTSTGKITAQYIFDGTNWILRQSGLVTTSLTPQHQNTSGTWANAQANSLTNVADDILLSNGDKVKYGKYTFVGHGFTPGANLYLSKTLAGTVTMTAPLDGDVHQKLAFVHDANTIEILVQEAFVQGSTASTTNSNTGISSGLVARGVDVQLDNFKVRVIQGAIATQNSLRISTVTGTTTLTAVSNQVITGGANFVGNSASLVVGTTPVELQAGWSYVQGGTQFSYFYDPTSGKAYRVTAIYATSNGSSHITIERI